MAEPRVAIYVTPAQLRALEKKVGWPSPAWLSAELARVSKEMRIAVREQRRAEKERLTEAKD